MPFNRPGQIRSKEKLGKQDMTFSKTYRCDLENTNEMTHQHGLENMHETPVKKQNGMPIKRECQNG